MRPRGRIAMFAALAAAAGSAACASVRTPADLARAEALYRDLRDSATDERTEGSVLRAEKSVTEARTALERTHDQVLVDGLSYVALRYVEAAESERRRVAAERETDSLRTERLQRLLDMSEAQRNELQRAQRLSQAEIDSLREHAERVRVQADSLRKAIAAANEQLNAALQELQALTADITGFRETSRGIVITLSDILFDVNKSSLRPGGEATVRRIAAILQQYPEHELLVEGHTDSTGTEDLNLALSASRAMTVRDVLIGGGIDPSRITSHGFGSSQPVMTNETPQGRQMNRRVDIIIVGAGEMAAVAAREADSLAHARALQADSAGVRVDSSAVRPDSGRVPPDTGKVRPDTGKVRPDTVKMRPDTGKVRPDTGKARPDTGKVRSDTGKVRPDTGNVGSAPRGRASAALVAG
jgi:outer membrane protein OmpA-like peptidoglycan-associated protein